MDKNESIRNAKDFEEILEIEYGKVGTEVRDEFEEKARYFIITELLNESRH
jgi:HTH-type transcriptional regulator / antitoxin HipB